MVFINSFLKKTSLIDNVLLLRTASIVIQSCLVIFVNLFLDYQLPWQPIMAIISLEIVFNISCFIYAKRPLNNQQQHNHLFFQLLFDTIFLGCLLYFSGGATNAFVSLLLIPMAIAAVTLSTIFLGVITCLAILIYSFLLWLMPMHVMHGNMEGHFIGMWINFLFSAIVVSLVISRMAKAITRKEITIAQYREEQLKQEKIIALGVASAQVTHNLATPLATIRLLTDELLEGENINDILPSLAEQVSLCSANLQAFRQATFDIKSNKKQQVSCLTVLQQVISHCALTYPEITINYQYNKQQLARTFILSDSSLLPAIVNIIDNAVSAAMRSNIKGINIASEFIFDEHENSLPQNKEKWLIKIQDFGNGFNIEQFSLLGNFPIESKQGLGVAMLLTHASLERLGGKLTFNNHAQGGAEVIITYPIAHINLLIDNT